MLPCPYRVLLRPGLRKDVHCIDDAHTGRQKKESHVVGQEPGDRSDCFRFDDFAAECCEQQYHADDAARYETARQRTDKFAGGVKQQNDENSR